MLWQADASTVATRVTGSKKVGQVVTIAKDDTGAAYFSFGGFAGNGSRYCVTGTTAPKNASWFYNDVWFGAFTGTMIQ